VWRQWLCIGSSPFAEHSTTQRTTPVSVESATSKIGTPAREIEYRNHNTCAIGDRQREAIFSGTFISLKIKDLPKISKSFSMPEVLTQVLQVVGSKMVARDGIVPKGVSGR
jgi:hypothetical protein